MSAGFTGSFGDDADDGPSAPRGRGRGARPYPMRPYPMRPYPMRPYPMRPYPMRPYPMRPYPMRPYDGTDQGADAETQREPGRPYPMRPYPMMPIPSRGNTRQRIGAARLNDQAPRRTMQSLHVTGR